MEGKLKSETPNDIRFNDPTETRYNIEPVNDVKSRINDFFDEIIDESSDEKILLVSHAGAGMYIIEYFYGKPPQNDYRYYKLKNCELKEFTHVKKRHL